MYLGNMIQIFNISAFCFLIEKFEIGSRQNAFLAHCWDCEMKQMGQQDKMPRS